MKYIFLGLIKIYKMFISPLFPNSCRFYPTCSQYAYEAINRYGAFTGLWLAVKRISRCHPLNPGGFDPVPEIDKCGHNHEHSPKIQTIDYSVNK